MREANYKWKYMSNPNNRYKDGNLSKMRGLKKTKKSWMTVALERRFRGKRATGHLLNIPSRYSSVQQVSSIFFPPIDPILTSSRLNTRSHVNPR